MRAYYEQNNANIWPINIEAKEQGFVENQITIQGISSEAFIKLAIGLPFRWIGVEKFILSNGLYSRLWETFDHGVYQKTEPVHTWSGISYSAKKQGFDAQSKHAQKINFSLQASALRLRDISHQYKVQLLIALNSKIKPGNRYTNMEFFDLIMALHSFLAEICSVRDYLAGYISAFILKHNQPSISMAGLLKQIKKNNSTDDLSKKVLELCDKASLKPWMANLGQHRDNIIHNAPLNQQHENEYAKYDLINVPGISQQLPFVTYDIFLDPYNMKPNDKKIDALKYFQEVYLAMLNFADFVSTYTGVKPEYQHFLVKNGKGIVVN